MGWGFYLSFPIVKQPSGRMAAITNNTNHAFRLKVEMRNDGWETVCGEKIFLSCVTVSIILFFILKKISKANFCMLFLD